MKKLYLSILIAIFIFSPLKIQAENITVTCGNGYFSDFTPFNSIPAFDYGPDGLVRFHISLNPDGWLPDYMAGRYYRITQYSSSCESVKTEYKNGGIPVGISNFLVKAIETSPGLYSFEAYNEDTGEILANQNSFPAPFSDPIVQFSTFRPYGVSGMYGYYERGAWTPIVPVKNPNFVSTKVPILIVPGILGTNIYKGNDLLWANPKMSVQTDNFMDPLEFKLELTPSDYSLEAKGVVRKLIFDAWPVNVTLFDYSDGLINEMVSQGYTEGKDLFTFPYDWRYGVSGKFADGTSVVDQLKGQIDYIINQTDAGKATGKVDVVAHSTGGLVLKKYVIDHPTDHHINKALFVGVPNLGAPKAFKVLIDGDNFGVAGLNSDEMKKLSQNFPVSYDLAPSQNYYQEKGSFYHISDWDPDTMQLPQLKDLNLEESYDRLIQVYGGNSQAVNNAKNLHSQSFDEYDLRNDGVDVYKVVGCKSGTVGTLHEFKSKFFFGITRTSFEAPDEISGDGTVPFESANSIPGDSGKTYFVQKPNHGTMLSSDGSRQLIVNLLSGSNLNTGDKIITHDQLVANQGLCQLNGRVIQIKSPVAISVTDQEGNYSGLAEDGSEQNDIPGADYEVWGEHKYVFLPTDEGQSYFIKLQGTGDGTFTVDDQTIEGDKVVQTQVFSNLPVTTSLIGQVNLGNGNNETTLLLQQTSTSSPVTVHPNSILNSTESQDLIPPVSTSTIAGSLGQPGFYRSNVSVTLSATDQIVPGHENETSGVFKTQYSLDGGEYTVLASSSPVMVTTEGPHLIKFYSTDRAGNNEQNQEINFVIDKTPPELIIQFDPQAKDLVFTATDTLPTIVTATSTLNRVKWPKIPALKFTDSDNIITATDPAGNTIQLTLKDKDRKHLLKADIKSLAYNGQMVDVNKTKFNFVWNYDKKGNLTQLTQNIQSKKNFNILAIYNGKKTSLVGLDAKGIILKTLNGLSLLKVTTLKGDLGWGY